MRQDIYCIKVEYLGINVNLDYSWGVQAGYLKLRVGYVIDNFLSFLGSTFEISKRKMKSNNFFQACIKTFYLYCRSRWAAFVRQDIYYVN